MVANPALCGPEVWALNRGLPLLGKKWSSLEVMGNDIHQLAITAYRLLTGRKLDNLWEDDRGRHVWDHSDEKTRLSPDEKLSDEVFQVISKAIAFSPNNRHASCTLFADEFTNALI